MTSSKDDKLALAPDYIRKRIERGQQFNAYERNDDRWAVAIGPVTDCQRLAVCETEEEACFVVAALRASKGDKGDA